MGVRSALVHTLQSAETQVKMNTDIIGPLWDPNRRSEVTYVLQLVILGLAAELAGFPQIKAANVH
ncbi:hypothetical protein LTR78_005469 [Recurvomyces mirabilis]|uniref:Uncharacterized protein n=1 Tax=Recurvomyces mirabilis TaxID=574656 RepID=A0AAE0WN10_9PEZI|nr:hypothetical protein LTR78_005469 [Recurvomyces mirabilis]KAK5152623.1 hypothetical protein LTS14_008157 [Recurvomyces mirabilis]